MYVLLYESLHVFVPSKYLFIVDNNSKFGCKFTFISETKFITKIVTNPTFEAERKTTTKAVYKLHTDKDNCQENKILQFNHVKTIG